METIQVRCDFRPFRTQIHDVFQNLKVNPTIIVSQDGTFGYVDHARYHEFCNILFAEWKEVIKE